MLKCKLSQAVLALAGIAIVSGCANNSAVAADRQITIRDYTGRGFSPDLVNYTVPAKDATKLRVITADGKVLPTQTAPNPDKKTATLSFVTAVPQNGAVSYTVRDNGKGAIPGSAVKATAEGANLVLSNALLAVRVPKAEQKTFKTPVAASTLPAPILTFRGSDGNWRGDGKVLTDRKVTAFRVTNVAGPAFTEMRYSMDFDGGGYYHATVQVVDQVPLVKVREEFDAKELSGKDYWELNLTKGWSPDSLETASAWGNGEPDRGKVVPLSQLGATPNPIQPKWTIVSGHAWVTPRNHIGLFTAADKTAHPDNYPIVGFTPLYHGDWRRALAIEIHSSDSKEVRLHLPMSGRLPSPNQEVGSETSPMMVGEHEPGLPITYSRRDWGLLLAEPKVPEDLDVLKAPIGPVYQAHLMYGMIGLDRYKDFILDWPDTGVTYPREYLTPADVEKFRAYVKELPEDSEMAKQLKRLYLISGDAELAKTRTEELKKSLLWNAHYILSSPTLTHHMSFSEATADADDVLAWKEMPAADRQEIRARLAFIAYLEADSDIQNHGTGTHLGNPNMPVARTMNLANYVAMLPDHPMYSKWRDYATMYTAYKQAINTAPGGGWFEFGAAYHMHSLERVTRALMGLNAMDAKGVDQARKYLDADWRYYMNLVTPYDSRNYSRMIPGGANSPPGHLADFYHPSGVFEKSDPALAEETMTLWKDNGSLMWSYAGIPLGMAGRPWLPRREPQLTSQIFPGVGVIFRAHQGPDETYMFLRSGYNWSHWYTDDQNNFSLISKGAVLVPYQPFQYYTSSNPEMGNYSMYNTIRFGDPANQYPWGYTDSNVLDHAFGPTVDYAWASAGYPEWYSASWQGNKLAPGIAQQQGPFHWNRQVMFLKGATGKSPNYFVFRDTTAGDAKLANWFNLDLIGRKGDVQQNGSHLAVNTEFPTKLDLQFTGQPVKPADMIEDDMGFLQSGPIIHKQWLQLAKDKPVSPNWVRSDGKPADATAANMPERERHVILRIPGGVGQEYFWLAYPRGAGEAAPTAEQLAPGVMKILTGEGTDYVFLAPHHFKFEGQDVSFEGSAGAVRIKGDSVTLALTGGSGRVGYKGNILSGTAPFERTIKLGDLKSDTETVKTEIASMSYKAIVANPQAVSDGIARAANGTTTEYVINSEAPVQWSEGNVRIDARQGAVVVTPAGVRFVASDRNYMQCSVGGVGVRGIGPFDITISKDKITGTVDGDTRTIVATKPVDILRPMYHMDGVRWYAGFPDNPPATDPNSPQFCIAMGVTEGKHDVLISEWTYPQLPPVTPRRALQ